ncbi:MAG: hypothetical protein O7E54_11800 [Planctomycetota bacterium]|nr:hypothetical protein [Planctomycetota bacterium]
MRTLVLLLLSATIALAQGAPQELQELFGGGEGWGRLSDWHQHEILRVWRHFQRLPEKRQSEIKRRGLREFLVQPGKRFRLPDPLREEIEQIPEQVRGVARKLAVMRLRTMRLDRALRMVPIDQRRPLFDRLFPRRFERAKAHEAWKDLEQQVSRAMARRALKRIKDKEARLGRSLTTEERAKVVHMLSSAEESKVLARVRKEIRRFRSIRPDQVRRVLAKDGYHLLERHPLMRSPRQRELIRYAFRPSRCPLVDLRFMGPRPTDAAARRLWDRDFRVLARIDLLSGDFPPEMVLHVAAAGSPADFFRAIKAYH